MEESRHCLVSFYLSQAQESRAIVKAEDDANKWQIPLIDRPVMKNSDLSAQVRTLVEGSE